MAITKSQSAIQWGGLFGETVSSGGTLTSDAEPISDAAIAGSVSIKADNVGTPTSGDTVDVKILYSTGDLPGLPDGADEFDTPGHAMAIRLDTNAGDPAIVTIPINTAAKAFKVYVKSNAASGVAMSGQYSQQVVS